MICLGIETTAHTFGVGIINDDGEILANEKDAWTSEEGGIIPYEVADHHFDCWKKVLEDALDEANLELEDIDVFSFSQGPGIGHSLRVGAFVARCLSLKYDKPIIGVNHCIGHISIGELLTEASDPVMLYVSGANTQVIAYEGEKYRVFGETLDMGTGNFLDKIAQELKLGFPGGPKIEELAEESNELIDLPYVVKGMDISLGGIFTNVKQKIHNENHPEEDIAYSVQETVFAMLIEVAERAMAHTGKDELLLGGGVACNQRLQEMCQTMCDERDASFYVPQPSVLVDNGVMIAWQGLIEHQAGKEQSIENTRVRPYWRTDQVEVNWR